MVRRIGHKYAQGRGASNNPRSFWDALCCWRTIPSAGRPCRNSQLMIVVEHPFRIVRLIKCKGVALKRQYKLGGCGHAGLFAVLDPSLASAVHLCRRGGRVTRRPSPIAICRAPLGGQMHTHWGFASPRLHATLPMTSSTSRSESVDQCSSVPTRRGSQHRPTGSTRYAHPSRELSNWSHQIYDGDVFRNVAVMVD